MDEPHVYQAGTTKYEDLFFSDSNGFRYLLDGAVVRIAIADESHQELVCMAPMHEAMLIAKALNANIHQHPRTVSVKSRTARSKTRPKY